MLNLWHKPGGARGGGGREAEGGGGGGGGARASAWTLQKPRLPRVLEPHMYGVKEEIGGPNTPWCS